VSLRAGLSWTEPAGVSAGRLPSLTHIWHPSPGAVDPGSRRRRRYADVPTAARLTGLGAGEWSALRSHPSDCSTEPASGFGPFGSRSLRQEHRRHTLPLGGLRTGLDPMTIPCAEIAPLRRRQSFPRDDPVPFVHNRSRTAFTRMRGPPCLAFLP
jgi:hypothetical protein